ncbi:MAG TPA: hypothetical protein VGQ05_10260 [Streptosporangiaceae bacterium]|jgi:hypothetical protein|nr:hypothetical protein [Streptosporangiaceae bacterium]
MSSRWWWPGLGRRRTDQEGAAETFGVLGLAADPELTDDEVRMAWRRVAAATHPDRADGGDPAAFAAAAAAYSMLRTRSGRGEALAGTAGAVGLAPPHGPGQRGTRWLTRRLARLPRRIGAGRPWRLAARVAVAVALSAAALAIVGSAPAGPALITGAVTWLVLTVRHDLAPDQRSTARPAGSPSSTAT